MSNFHIVLLVAWVAGSPIVGIAVGKIIHRGQR
jgi:hypothetical protein